LRTFRDRTFSVSDETLKTYLQIILKQAALFLNHERIICELHFNPTTNASNSDALFSQGSLFCCLCRAFLALEAIRRSR
jgi:hypothetical protein